MVLKPLQHPPQTTCASPMLVSPARERKSFQSMLMRDRFAIVNPFFGDFEGKTCSFCFVGNGWFIFNVSKTRGTSCLLMRSSGVKPSMRPQVVIRMLCDL